MQSITNTDVPIGLYNKLMEGLNQELSRAENSPFCGLKFSLVVKFTGVVSDDALDSALALLDQHNIKTATQLGLAPNVIAQLSPHMHAYLLRKCGLAASDVPGCDATRDLEEEADEVIEKHGKSVLREKKFKEHSMVGVFCDMKSIPAEGITISVDAPEKGWSKISVMKRIFKSLKGQDGGKRQAVEVQCVPFAPQEIQQRNRCVEALQACVTALRQDKADQNGKKKQQSPIRRMALKCVEKLESKVQGMIDAKNSNIEPTHALMLTRVNGPFIFNDKGNTDHFVAGLFEQLSQQVGVDKGSLTFVPATLSHDQVSAVLQEVEKAEKAAQGQKKSEPAGSSAGARSVSDAEDEHHERGLAYAALCILICVAGVLIAVVMVVVIVFTIPATIWVLPVVGMMGIFFFMLIPLCWVVVKEAFGCKKPKDPGYTVTITRVDYPDQPHRPQQHKKAGQPVTSPATVSTSPSVKPKPKPILSPPGARRNSSANKHVSFADLPKSSALPDSDHGSPEDFVTITTVPIQSKRS